MGTIISILNSSSLSNVEFEQLVWAIRYQCLYHFNRSPWVEHGYTPPVTDVLLLAAGVRVPTGSWPVELLDTSDQPGALGYHEDQAFDQHSKGPKKSSGRSSRGIAIHPLTGESVPLAKVFVKTSEEDGVQPSEVASHETLEMLVDPQVVNEAKTRKYLNPATKQWYIGEVGDAAQGRGYDVGQPEKRTTGVIVADFCYPAWWKQEQTRTATTFGEDAGIRPRLEPFALAPGGYMSVAPEAEPTNWTQIYGSNRAG